MLSTSAFVCFFNLALFGSGASTGVEANRNLSSYRKSVDVHFMPGQRLLSLHFLRYTPVYLLLLYSLDK